jgi:endoglucanase
MTPRRAILGVVLAGLAGLQLACQALPARRPTEPAPSATHQAPAVPAGGAATPPAAPTPPAAAPVASATALPATPAGAATASPRANRPPVKELPSGEIVSPGPLAITSIRVDQVGYLPAYRKLGLVADSKATSFALVDPTTNRSVYAAELGAPMRDEDTGETVRTADFSAVVQPGMYALAVPGVGHSAEFRIGADVYQKLFADAVASYDHLADLAPANWKTARATDRKTGRDVDVTGGWPDAGDYGRYMPTATSSLGTLMMLVEMSPSSAVSTPSQAESTAASSQYLTVLKRELDWMLKMQREDGGVYHKVTPLNFGGFDKGQDNIGGPLVAFGPSTPDTATFAAVTAQAARVYRSSDPAYADRLLGAARRAWGWLEQHPEPILPTGEGTGGYTLGSDRSQRLWASVELHRTTGEAAFGDYARKQLTGQPVKIGALSWSDSQTYALMSYLNDPAGDPELRQTIGAALTSWADSTAVTLASPDNPQRVALAVYEWASNKTALDNAALLMLANRVTPTDRYVEAALDQLHYVLGRNAMSKSYVTGYGQVSVLHPHNRTIFSIGRLVPGVMVGGPNGRAEDGIAPAAEGPRSYVDDQRAYSVNENAIDYNASLVLITGLFQPA